VIIAEKISVMDIKVGGENIYILAVSSGKYRPVGGKAAYGLEDFGFYYPLGGFAVGKIYGGGRNYLSGSAF
jgi:hypothetical protein